QRAVVTARHVPARLEEAVSTVDGISLSRWADVAPWLWLELSLLTYAPAQARAWIDRAGELGGGSDHLSLVTALAQLRSGLLVGADAEALAAASAARALLSDRAGPGSSSPSELRFVQEPHVTLLASLWDAGGGRGLTVPEPCEGQAFEQAVAQVTEQAAGLTRPLAESLMRRSRFWLRELRHR